MIESHKRLLLNGFYEEFGKLDVKNTDNIRVSLSEGAESAINAMVLASIAPWLSESLELEGAAVYMPDVSSDDFIPFASNLMQDKDFFHVDEVAKLIHSVSVVCKLLKNDFFSDTLVVEQPPAIAVRQEEILLSDVVDEETQLLLNPIELDDRTLVDNFSDQDQRLVCLVCYKIFQNDFPDNGAFFRSFKEHLETHSKSQLKKIKIIKTQSLPIGLKCSLCGNLFDDHRSASDHVKNSHSTNENGLIFNVCQVCGYESTKYPSLVCHMRRHQSRKYSCDVCHRKFLQKRWLEVHRRKDNCGLSRRKCDHCQKVYATSTALKLHLRKLRGEKEFACQVCEKTFPEKRSLKEHYLTHRRDRHHACPHCSKTYVQKNHLLYHLASAHNTNLSGTVSKHVCKICNKSYAFKYLLKRHEESHVSTLVKHFNDSEVASTQHQLSNT